MPSTNSPTATPSGQAVPTSSSDIKAIRDKQAAAQANVQTYDPQNPPVFMGRKSSLGGAEQESRRFMPGPTPQVPDVKNYQDAVNQFYMWDDATKAKFRSELALAGANTDQMSDGQLAKAWESYVAQSGAYWQNGNGRGLTPWDILAMDRTNREKQGPTKTTSTSTALDISTRQDAQAIAQSAARSLLGRDPTQSEITKLLGTLNQYERNNPRVTTSESIQQPGGGGTQTSTTTGGVSDAARQVLAQEQAKQNPEYGAYQAATTYYEAMMQVLGRGY